MDLRIVSAMSCVRRKYYVERHYRWRGWTMVGSPLGYVTEDDAKEWAQDYAKGTWVSDTATF